MSNLLFAHAVDKAYKKLRNAERKKWINGKISEQAYWRRVDALDRAAQKRSAHYGYLWVWN